MTSGIDFGSYNAPAGYGAPPAPASSYNAPAPSYNAPAPSYNAPAAAPSYNAPSPSYNSNSPSSSLTIPNSGAYLTSKEDDQVCCTVMMSQTVDIKLISDQPGVHQSDQQRAGPAQTDPRLTAGRRGPTFSGGERRDHHPPQSQD